MAFIIFLLLGSVLCYAWVGYPYILKFVSKYPARDVNSLPDVLPDVAIILSAYNEEEYLQARLENLLTVDYPAERLTVYVGLDGCDDGSASIANSVAACDNRVYVYDFNKRRGKVSVLKDLVKHAMESIGADGILLFTDANTMFRRDVLKKMVPHFCDEKVGGVCGRLVFLPAEGVREPGQSESSYWTWETKLKIAESYLDSCLGANGAVYAMRTGLFWKDIPDNTLIDDFVLGMKVREYGLRFLYEEDAVAEEVLPEQSAEWTRRIRIGAGDYQALGYCWRCLLPQYGKFAWMFWSHKVLRWFTPHILLVMLFVGVYMLYSCRDNIWSQFIFMVGIAAVVVMVLIGLLDKIFPKRYRVLNLLLLPGYFVVMQIALFVGFIRYCRGGLKGHWTRTPR